VAAVAVVASAPADLRHVAAGVLAPDLPPMTGESGARTDLSAVAAVDLPLALADLYAATAVGDRVEVLPPDDVGPLRWDDLVLGAGFRRRGRRVERLRTLPDTVGPGMRLLVCGLNPSVYSADVGHGFARPGNRYWPAALAAGIVTEDHDPRHALVEDRIGMTDLVKRATPRADELTTDEYRAGVERVSALVEWLRPGAVVMVGLAGWRAAVDRKAVAGVQPDPFGGRPVYVMPSTSGLNAHSRLDDLAGHLRAAVAVADA
jgi:TDG/mug DNA glycosylase family protein